MPVTSHTRLVMDDRIPLADDTVEESGLANIGAADDGHDTARHRKRQSDMNRVILWYEEEGRGARRTENGKERGKYPQSGNFDLRKLMDRRECFAQFFKSERF